MRTLPLVAALLLAACAAPAGPELVVSVRVTGALTREGIYAQPAGPRHLCRSYLPSGPLPTFWDVSFNDDRNPPENSFTLRFPTQPNPRMPDGGVMRLTAGGRVWRFQRTPEESAAKVEIRPDDGFLTGRFRVRDLSPDDGGPDRIDVEGNWRCPPPRPD